MFSGDREAAPFRCFGALKERIPLIDRIEKKGSGETGAGGAGRASKLMSFLLTKDAFLKRLETGIFLKLPDGAGTFGVGFCMILEKGFSRAFEAFGRGQRLPGRSLSFLSFLTAQRATGRAVLSEGPDRKKILYLPDLSFFVSCFRDFGVETLRFCGSGSFDVIKLLTDRPKMR